MIKAVIFDFDGLIVDTESVWFESYQNVLKGYGINLTLEEFVTIVGTDGTDFFRSLCMKANRPLTIEELSGMARKTHTEIMLNVNLRDGVLDYLTDAKKMGLKIGLASSSRRSTVEPLLKRYGIFDFFEVIKTKDDVKKVKPDPELYIQAIAALEVKKDEVVSFEDSAHGCSAAVTAGVKCVVVPNPMTKGLQFKNHAFLISSMGEMTLGDLLAKIS